LVKTRILFNPINRGVFADKGTRLLDAMQDEDIHIEALCGGKGFCGKCKVILEKGKIEKISTAPDKLLSKEELEAGYFLACNIRIIEDSIFTIPSESRIDKPKILVDLYHNLKTFDPATQKYLLKESKINNFLLLSQPRIILKGYSGISPRISDEIFDKYNKLNKNTTITATLSRTNGFPEIIQLEEGDTTDSNYGLAIDIGTTTIVGVLVELNSGIILAKASRMNKQITYGEDLVTRISISKTSQGLVRLQKAVIESINNVIDELCIDSSIDPLLISDVSVGGNTVMNHLFVGLDCSYLEIADMDVSREPIIIKAKDIKLKINPETYIYVVSNVSRFLGGDAIGDVLASDMHKSNDMSLMVDLGTNGEIIFGNRNWLFSCSCASGPAFEGEGVRQGMRASFGGIDHIEIDDKTLKAKYTVIGGSKPKGICGSGLIDGVAEMFRVGIMDFAGKIVPNKPNVRKGKWGLEYVVVPANKTSIGKDIVITQSDLDYVIDSKAAACGAITVLMKKLKIGIEDVKNIYLAGAFGTYSDLKNATRLGIFPEFPNGKIQPIGNGSLSGAYITLLSMQKRKEARQIAEMMVYVDLLIDLEFIDEYSKALYVPGSKEYFPSLS
jgi:uncharacterized 2Fe-2S/4Fe-4S cluster protein (DUF4445 family)